jgi:hypothetical protein
MGADGRRFDPGGCPGHARNLLKTRALSLGTDLVVHQGVTRANGGERYTEDAREAAMKRKTVSIGILVGLVFSLLSAGVAMGAGAEGNERMSRIERATAVESRSAESRKTETFRTDKTDSWLCNYVSPFFCTSLFPTLSSSPNTPKSPSTPARGRN